MLGTKFGPIPNAKMFFFPTSRQLIPNLTFFSFFFILVLSIFISYMTDTEHIVTYLQFHRIIEYNHTCFFSPSLIVHYGKFNYWNQSSNGNLHKDHVKFPNFSQKTQKASNFPNSMGPSPILKKGCESPVRKYLQFYAEIFVYINLCPHKRRLRGHRSR